MNDVLSTKAQQIEPSATMVVADLVRELNNQGHDVINLSAGEPDFDTPDPIKQSAIEAIQEGWTKYTNIEGTPTLKKAIMRKLRHDNQLDYELNQIIVSNGAKQSIYNAIMTVLNAGNEAIIPAPYWVSYLPIVKMAAAVPIIIQTTLSQNFKITPQQLEEAITPNTRLLILNSPSNPSGVAYSKSELRALAEILLKHPKVLILSDDIYEYILWGADHFTNIVNVCPQLQDRTIVINGASKAFAMTGWRIGYAAAPKTIVQAMKKIQSQSTSCPNSIAQVAATTALGYDRGYFSYMYKAYKARHDLALQALNQIKGVRCIPADGAFYLFPDVREIVKRLKLPSDIELSTHLLNKTNVAVVPGSAFGSPGHIRLSCTTSNKNLKEALDRLSSILH